MRDERLLLRDIIAALDRIDSFTYGMEFDNFVADEKTVNAVIYNFMIIGEAVKQLPESVIDLYPEIPWRQVAGMRDKLVHAYFSIDYDLVWKTVTIVLPQFRDAIGKILSR